MLTREDITRLLKTEPLKVKGNFKRNKVYINGKELKQDESQEITNEANIGFMWGIGGAGSSQLALAILFHIVKDVYAVTGGLWDYETFKWEHVVSWPFGDFEITLDIKKFFFLNITMELIEKFLINQYSDAKTLPQICEKNIHFNHCEYCLH